MSYRLQRVCEVLKRELGMIILRECEFSSQLVTIQSVDVTPDLRQAHIYVSVLGSDAQRRESIEKLEAKRVEIQLALTRRVTLKNTPHLYFKLDDSIERGVRVIKLMDELGLDP